MEYFKESALRILGEKVCLLSNAKPEVAQPINKTLDSNLRES